MRGLVALVAVLVWGGGAHAQEGPVARLVFEAGAQDGCPDEETLRDTIVGRLGRDPFREEAGHTVLVRVEPRPEGLRGSLALLDSGGHALGRRELDAPLDGCAELVDALSVVVAIALDPVTGLIAEASEPAQRGSSPPTQASPETARDASEGPPAAAGEAEVEPAPAPEAADSRALRLGVVLGGSLAVGRTIDPGVGGQLGGRVEAERFAIGLEGSVHVPTAGAQAGGAEIDTLHVGVAVSGCLRAGLVDLCLPVTLGMLEARSRGTDDAPARKIVAHAGFRLGLTWSALSDLTLLPFVQLDANLVQPSIRVDGRRVWTAPLVSLLLGISLAFFP